MITPISFELAKLLREKGFDRYCRSGYTEKGDVYLHQGGQEFVKNGHGYYEGSNYNGGEFYCSAPTVAQIIMWLYEKYGIWIYSFRVKNYEEVKWYYTIETTEDILLYSPMLTFNNPIEALEAGIEYVLTTLI